MPKTLLIIADGLSNSMLDIPTHFNLPALSDTDLAGYYPECLRYRDIWKAFRGRRHISPAPVRAFNATSASASLMLSAGATETLSRFQTDWLHERGIFHRCAEKKIATAAVTNCPITDSTIGMFLDPAASRLYEGKSESGNANAMMQCVLAEKILAMPWDILAGGGRWAFFGKSDRDPVTGESGLRSDEVNLLDRLRTAKNLRMVFEDDYAQLGNPLDPDSRYLFLLHHNYFKYQAERPRVYAPEPRMSELVMGVLGQLDNRSDDWLCVAEFGRIDHAAHGNNLYFLLGEILELFRFLHRLESDPRFRDCNVMLVSDHGTGGLEFRDRPGIIFDAFRGGSTWSDGPGMSRRDRVVYFQKPSMHQIADYTPKSASLPGLRSQPSAEPSAVACHNRSLVPCLFRGGAFASAGFDDFIGVHHVLAESLLPSNPGLAAVGGRPDVLIVTGPPGSGKSTLSAAIASRRGFRVVSGDDYLNGLGEDLPFGEEKILLAVETALFDADCILQGKTGVILDFVFISEPELILVDAFLRRHSGRLVVLQADPETAMARDAGRPQEERMGERCAALAIQFAASRARFTELGAYFPDWRKPAEEIASETERACFGTSNGGLA